MSASRPAKPDLLVVGVGNEMMRDEGVGMAVARELQGRELGARVRVLELGTRGFDLICEMEGVARVIVIDAVRAGGEPGSIYQFTPEQAQGTNDAGGTEVPPSGAPRRCTVSTCWTSSSWPLSPASGRR